MHLLRYSHVFLTYFTPGCGTACLEIFQSFNRYGGLYTVNWANRHALRIGRINSHCPFRDCTTPQVHFCTPPPELVPDILLCWTRAIALTTPSKQSEFGHITRSRRSRSQFQHTLRCRKPARINCNWKQFVLSGIFSYGPTTPGLSSSATDEYYQFPSLRHGHQYDCHTERIA